MANLPGQRKLTPEEWDEQFTPKVKLDCPSYICTFYTKSKESKFDELIQHMLDRHHLDVECATKLCERRKEDKPDFCVYCMQKLDRRKK